MRQASILLLILPLVILTTSPCLAVQVAEATMCQAIKDREPLSPGIFFGPMWAKYGAGRRYKTGKGQQ